MGSTLAWLKGQSHSLPFPLNIFDKLLVLCLVVGEDVEGPCDDWDSVLVESLGLLEGLNVVHQWLETFKEDDWRVRIVLEDSSLELESGGGPILGLNLS